MVEQQQVPVIPGPVDPAYPPQFTEVVCTLVNKVYDACSQRECELFCFTPEFPPEEILGAQILPNTARLQEWSIVQSETPPLAIVTATICADLQVTYEDTADFERTEVEEVCFEKAVLLYAPDVVDFDWQVRAEAIFEVLDCQIVPFENNNNVVEYPEDQICCWVGAFIILKTVLEVQLLIPAFGFCPVPAECIELPDFPDPCPPFFERPFPPFFPPQPWDFVVAE